MALRIDVRSNIREVISDLGTRQPAVVRRAAASGLNKGMAASVTATVRSIAKDVSVAQKWIRQRFKRRKATRARLIEVANFAPRGLNPKHLGMSPAQALKYYTGPRVSEPFVMRMPNGSEQIVVRLPQSRNPSDERSRTGARRKGRLPVASIRIFIGRDTVDEMIENMNDEGLAAFEKEYRRIFIANWK